MEFSLSDERRMLQDSLRGTLERHADSPDLWPALAGLGAGAALLPEEAGGFGGTGTDIALVAGEVGRAGAVVPLIDSVILGAAVLAAVDGADTAAVTALVEGTATAALADLEPGARYDGTLATTARPGPDIRLDGRKTLVVGGDSADWFMVTALDSDDARGLYLVAGDAPGLTRRSYDLMDGGRGADLEFVATPARHLGTDALLDRPVAAATLAVCADAVGVMDRVLEMTADYLRTRKQFGQPIGRFQVLGHRMADLWIEVEQARSAVMNLATRLDDPARDLHLSAAKVTVGEAAQLVAEEAIQMHGGIGLTQDYGLGVLVRRLIAADARFGDRDYHLERFAALRRG